MKLRKIFSLGIIALIMLGSCSEELEMYPKNQLTPETITSDDINLLVRGSYASLRYPISYFYLGFLTEDLSGDNLIYRATFFQHGEVDNNAILAANVLNARYYNGPYTIIQSANDVINLITESGDKINDDVKKEALSQVKYIRAYSYYKLVTLFGGVPIIETRDPDKQLVKRSTEEEVWNYIIEDLKYVVENGLPFSDATYVSKEAGQALLARVYLLRNKNTEALTLANELIANKNFELSSNYDAIWEKGASKEHIFYVNHTSTDDDAYHGYFLRHKSMRGGGRAELPVDKSLVSEYADNDNRKDASVKYIPDPSYAEKFHWFCNKFRDDGDGSAPFYVSRIAEAYLIASEASLKITDNPSDQTVLNPINTLRAKRGLTDLASANLYVIQKERRLELAFEGVRWTDMKRTPSATNPSKSVAQEFVEAKGRSINDLLYPIPTAAIDVNPELTQNPGY